MTQAWGADAPLDPDDGVDDSADAGDDPEVLRGEDGYEVAGPEVTTETPEDEAMNRELDVLNQQLQILQNLACPSNITLYIAIS